MVVSDQAARLQGVDELVLRVEVPERRLVFVWLFVLVPDAVEPYCPDRAILGEQLRQLVVHKPEVAVPISAVRSSGAVSGAPARVEIRSSPVQVGVVEMQFQAFFLTSLGDFPDYVTSERSGIHHIVGTRFGPEHRESVMMPCGYGEVPGARGLEGAYPLLRVELGRVEAIGKMGVFEVVEVAYLHHPFALTEH